MSVYELRRRTGAGLMECQMAINKANGDMPLAEGYMKYSGLAVNIKKEGMTPAQAHEEWVWDRAKKYAKGVDGNVRE